MAGKIEEELEDDIIEELEENEDDIIKELEDEIDEDEDEKNNENNLATNDNDNDNDILEVAKYLSENLYGELLYIKDGKASLEFVPSKQFAIDKHGNIHPGIIDSAGQFCALAAINHPNAIVSRTKTKFKHIVKEGMTLTYIAESNYNIISKKSVRVTATNNDVIMYESIISILTFEDHIFANSTIGDVSRRK